MVLMRLCSRDTQHHRKGKRPCGLPLPPVPRDMSTPGAVSSPVTVSVPGSVDPPPPLSQAGAAARAIAMSTSINVDVFMVFPPEALSLESVRMIAKEAASRNRFALDLRCSQSDDWRSQTHPLPPDARCRRADFPIAPCLNDLPTEFRPCTAAGKSTNTETLRRAGQPQVFVCRILPSKRRRRNNLPVLRVSRRLAGGAC